MRALVLFGATKVFVPVTLLVALLAGCGDNKSEEAGPVGCQSDIECSDSNACTNDRCAVDGACVHEVSAAQECISVGTGGQTPITGTGGAGGMGGSVGTGGQACTPEIRAELVEHGTGTFVPGEKGVSTLTVQLTAMCQAMNVKGTSFRLIAPEYAAGDASPFCKGDCLTTDDLNFRNFRLVDAVTGENMMQGTVVTGPSDPKQDGATTSASVRMTDAFFLKAGESRALILKADLANRFSSDRRFMKYRVALDGVDVGDGNIPYVVKSTPSMIATAAITVENAYCRPTLTTQTTWRASGTLPTNTIQTELFRVRISISACEDIEVNYLGPTLMKNSGTNPGAAAYCAGACGPNDWYFRNVTARDTQGKFLMGPGQFKIQEGLVTLASSELHGPSFIIPMGGSTEIVVALDVVNAPPGGPYRISGMGMGVLTKSRGPIDFKWPPDTVFNTVEIK